MLHVYLQVNDLIEHPPDASQVEAMLSGGQSAFPPGLGGLQLQSLLGGAANPQMLEQLLNSGVAPPGILPLEALRCVYTEDCESLRDTVLQKSFHSEYFFYSLYTFCDM